MEGPHSSPTWLLHTLSAHCLYCFPILVSLPSMPPVTVVSSGSSLFPWDPVAAGLTAGPSGTSKPYSWRASVPFSFLAPSALSECLYVLNMFILPFSTSAVPHSVIGGATGSISISISSP